MNSMSSIYEELLSLRDLKYKDFQAALVPTIDKETVLGIRMPALRKYAASIQNTARAKDFLQQLPHTFYEENNLHGILLEKEQDFETLIKNLEDFLPFINNWATCDLLRPAIFRRHLRELREYIRRWLKSSHSYTVRFAMEMLMVYYLEDAFSPDYPEWVCSACTEDYYVRMMAAWYFATALAKQYENALPWLLEKKLPVWVHNKTIQKAIESYRITPNQKVFLKTLRIKKEG